MKSKDFGVLTHEFMLYCRSTQLRGINMAAWKGPNFRKGRLGNHFTQLQHALELLDSGKVDVIGAVKFGS
jgi:hypothetical protein